MTRPPTVVQAEERGLLAADGHDVHTFSNGTEWDAWASGNCHACRFFDPDVAGKFCAFEGAAFMHCVSPELAALFGWEQRETHDGPRDGWEAPASCRFFRDAKDDDGDSPPPAPDPDPHQLVLLADPTEDAVLLRVVEARELVGVSA